MAKPSQPSQKEITAADLTDYLNSESDFAFEIRAIKELQKAGDVLHGGTYMDAITGKPRQFDIRVTISKDRCVIRLAVECKNLKTTFPLLVSCLLRRDDEAFQHIAASVDKRKRKRITSRLHRAPRTRRIPEIRYPARCFAMTMIRGTNVARSRIGEILQATDMECPRRICRASIPRSRRRSRCCRRACTTPIPADRWALLTLWRSISVAW